MIQESGMKRYSDDPYALITSAMTPEQKKKHGAIKMIGQMICKREGEKHSLSVIILRI